MQIASNDARALREAIRVAEGFAKQYDPDDFVGVAFLGAIVRGYFDKSADIDIGFFTKASVRNQLPLLLDHVDGYAVHSWVADYDKEVSSNWDMAKRWAYSESRVYWDPSGRLSRLIQEKVADGFRRRPLRMVHSGVDGDLDSTRKHLERALHVS